MISKENGIRVRVFEDDDEHIKPGVCMVLISNGNSLHVAHA